MAQRINISLSDDMLALLEKYSKSMGTPKASLCTMFIGQGLMNYENANKIAKTVLDEYAAKIMEQKEKLP